MLSESDTYSERPESSQGESKEPADGSNAAAGTGLDRMNVY